ncbi:DNA polymerase III subunit delta [Spirulina sp. CS-785/01]|uniref:DNA polymerase III subunit delta n=1 Tax=Spirulina sp. CS-785/01 TaxID=3021716 RepID=UPI002330DBC7|nr:DNA polymerase III subunit delta [Spirulina sp. CS-785/01]MDB9312611.1 DNA polymerase III subunit delta [Spirulina sp. CS-785/01]
MPVYVFWGEDDFKMEQAIAQLEAEVLDPNWTQFNYDRFESSSIEPTLEGLNQAMTPPFGMGGRFVWLADTILTQNCSESLLKELKRTLPNLPETSHLLLTSRKKPDGRSKATKFLQKHASIREFSLIPPWKTEEILKNVKQVAQEKGVKLTPKATDLLADSIGNNTRQLWTELDKLQLYNNQGKPLDDKIIARLVVANTQNSLQLAAALRDGKSSHALGLVADLINKNEPALRIVATLVGQFRMWLIVKLMLEKGEKDHKTIASAADIGNPKRLYFIRKELNQITAKKLEKCLPILLELEVSLKRGASPVDALQTKIVELCETINR